MSNTNLVLGSNWSLGEWPEHVTVIHEANVSHGNFSQKRKYVPERTTTRRDRFKTKYGQKVPLCKWCDYSIGDKRYNFCPNCGARVVEERQQKGMCLSEHYDADLCGACNIKCEKAVE